MKKYLKPNLEIETIELEDVILVSKTFDGMGGQVDVSDDWNNFWGN